MSPLRRLVLVSVVSVVGSCELGGLPVDRTNFACRADVDCGAGFRCVSAVCRASSSCSTKERCDDGLDNDCDEAVDCADVECAPECSADAGGDGGTTDAGSLDAGPADGGPTDAGGTDAGGTDAGGIDAGGTDAGGIDAGGTDAGGTDAGGTDAGGTDAGGADAGGTDAGGTDAGGTDAGGTDAGPGDAGILLSPSLHHFLGVLPGRPPVDAGVFTLLNRGTVSVSPTVALVGGDAGFFLGESTCPATLAPASSCSIAVGFEPTAVGEQSATLEVSASPAGVVRAEVRAEGLAHVGYVGPLAQLRAASTLPTSGGVAFNPTSKRLRITQADAGLDNVDLRGVWVTVEANNVTIRNCVADVDAGPFYVIDQYPGFSGLIVEDCDFDGLKANNVTAAFVTGRGGFVTVRRNYLHDAPSDMLKVSTGAVIGNYFTRAGYTPGAHADGVQSGGPGPLTITGNYFDWRMPTDLDGGAGTNSAVIVQPTGVSVDDVLIDGNVAFGGSSTFNVAPQPGAPYTITNARVTNNRLGFWSFYYLYPVNVPPTLVFTGNRHYVTGAPLSWP